MHSHPGVQRIYVGGWGLDARTQKMFATFLKAVLMTLKIHFLVPEHLWKFH